MHDSALLRYLVRLGRRLLSKGDLPGPWLDPDAVDRDPLDRDPLVRQPRPRSPKGRLGAIALEEPRERKRVMAVAGRRARRYRKRVK